ncbi:ribosome biogenesis GTP-binding protein YihA/YsxC [Candidatus Purcelliella pentastirinorum]|uniref:ribosome biogenesis GTP-binding protein YihA/YsxC n=1 Tax=Candidatus Purcelliella pentastirinorum TaxID=472834 RepID=UPI00237C328C|nr:ribosome biogenesis GTP-binding protein YihA/YsxC [Candidatus Purcelliella pentastirinorum]WDR80339.1 ribosome biogenesis GTP-binding protein YihA/YsxC [Candidatus Purcelliella pentastirinorum]
MNYNSINYKSIKFIKSINKIKDLPKDKCIEIAFIGYSNVGKSNTINALSNVKKMAFTGKKPGTTKLINLYQIIENFYLIDFPGYGYSNISLKNRNKHTLFLNRYIKKRKSLKGIIILIDIRQKLKKLDIDIIKKTNKKKSIIVLLNKIDKLSNNKINQKKIYFKNEIKKYNKNINIHPFSSINSKGLKILKKKINTWLTLHKNI